MYNRNHIDELKKLKTLNKEILPEEEAVEEDDGFIMDTSNVIIDSNIKEELNNNINNKLISVEIESKENKEEEVDINWDDI